MRKTKVTQRWFKCPGCNTIQAAFKNNARKTSEGHIKDMWCPWCKKEQKFVQIRYH